MGEIISLSRRDFKASGAMFGFKSAADIKISYCMRLCYCGRDAIALPPPISDKDCHSLEDTQTSLTEEI